MKRLRGKLTYANVMATIAVFLVLGGGAAVAAGLGKNTVGPKQLKKGAVTAAKIKQGAVTPAKLAPATTTQLTGPAGPAGPAGTALAFATVDENGQVVASQSKNISQAQVSSPEEGLNCFAGLGFAPKIAVVSPQFFAPDPVTAAVIVSNGGPEEAYECPPGTQVAVQTMDVNGDPVDSPIRVIFN